MSVFHSSKEWDESAVPLRSGDRARLPDPLRLVSGALTKLHSLWVSLTYPFASKGRNPSIHYTWDLKRQLAHRVKIGDSVIIGKDVWLNVARPFNENGGPVITLDDGCVIGRRSQISAKNCIHIERDVLFGPSALAQDHSHAYDDLTRSIQEQGVTEGGRIRIGEGSWIGHGAAIVCTNGELTLGRNCIVGANSVVLRSFPAYSVIMGNPARVVKQFDPQKGAWFPASSD